MPAAGPDATQNTPLAPSVEKAYYRKCIELKRRLNEVEEANDAARLRKLRLNRAIMKMRLERAFLLDQLAKRMELDDDDSNSNNNNNNNNNNNDDDDNNDKPQDAREGSASQTASLSRHAEHGPILYAMSTSATSSSGPALHPAFDARHISANYNPSAAYSASAPAQLHLHPPIPPWATNNGRPLSDQTYIQPPRPPIHPMPFNQPPSNQPPYGQPYPGQLYYYPLLPNHQVPPETMQRQTPVNRYSSSQTFTRQILPKQHEQSGSG